MAGYSETPLAKKLGIKPGSRIHLSGAPETFLPLISPLPERAVVVPEFDTTVDLVHLFATRRAQLQNGLQSLRPRLKADGVVWVSWPKKASKVPTDITEDVIRELALPMGLVDIKVCAVDEVWSGLKLMIRRELR